MMHVCCWHWVVSLRQWEQTLWSCTWHSAATVSRQDDGDDGRLVYLYVPGNICQNCCSRLCVSVWVRCRDSEWCNEIQHCSLLSFSRFLLCLSFSYNQNVVVLIWTIPDLSFCSTPRQYSGRIWDDEKRHTSSKEIKMLFLYLFYHVVYQTHIQDISTIWNRFTEFRNDLS